MNNEVKMYTLACKNQECLTEFRVGRFLKHPITRNGKLQFCPLCGGDAFVKVDNNEDYWESLARAYGMPVEAIVAVHGIWNPHEKPIFKEFLDEMMEEAKAVAG